MKYNRHLKDEGKYNIMKNRLLITLLIGISLIILTFQVSASMEYFGKFQQNECIRVTQTCTTCTYVTLSSISYPNSTVAVVGESMIDAGDGEWYFYFCNTKELGRYDVRGHGDKDGTDDPFTFYFEITSGSIAAPLVEQTTAQSIGSAMFLFLILGLTVLLGWIGFKLVENNYLWLLGVFFLFLSLLMVVYDVWLGYEYHRSFTGLTNSSMPETIFYIFMFLLIVGLLSSGALLFTKWKDWGRYIKNELRRKNEDQEFDKDFDRF